MSSLQEFNINYKYFLDQSTLLYGETKTGKSSIMVDILYHLKPFVEQIIVISPSDPQNHTYDRGVVPLPCIHYEITSELLNNIWERQNALAAVYSRANEPTVLKGLFDKITNNGRARDEISQIYRKLKEYKAEIESTESEQSIMRSKVSTMEKDCKELILLIWKRYISINMRHLRRLKLSADEQYSLKYLDLNPRLVLIFDDCTPDMKKFSSHPVMKKLFFQGRWAFITFLIACHTDKCIDPELKKNAFVSIFTEESCANGYFERQSNNFGKEAKERANNALRAAFTPMTKFQKLVWVREDKRFYKFTATIRDGFEFGGDILREYCSRCQSSKNGAVTNNKFIHDFD
jgi:hypothetical protein